MVSNFKFNQAPWFNIVKIFLLDNSPVYLFVIFNSTTQDSYCIDYFGALARYMKVGPPVYFVTTEGYDFSELEDQNYVCGGAGCEENSLSQQIYYASLISEQ